MRRSSAILLWAAVLIALLCTLASLVSLFYVAYGYYFSSGLVLHLSPVGPLIFTLAPLCWLYVFLKDRPALAEKDGRISTWIVLVCLVVFLAAIAWLHEIMTIV
jgi:hypothetical protein